MRDRYVFDQHRVEGGMLGLLLGARWATRMEPDSPLVHGVGAAQAMVMVDCLGRTVRRHLDRNDLVESLNRWLETGSLTASSVPTHVDAASECPDSERWPDPLANVVRALPLALWFRGPTSEAMSATARQVLSLSGTNKPLVTACVVICQWSRHLYRALEMDEAWAKAIDDIESIASDFSLMEEEFVAAAEWLRAPTENAEPAMELIVAAHKCLTGGASFEEAMTRASQSAYNEEGILATLVGGLAGIHIGGPNLPSSEVASLVANEEIQRAVAILSGRAYLSPSLTRLPQRTSSTHPIQISLIPLAGGQLALTDCPGDSNSVISTSWGPQWIRRELREDLERLCQLGVNGLITVLEPEEIIDSDLGELMSEAHAANLEWYHLPLARDAAPDEYADRELAACLPKLRALLDRGGILALHAGSWFDERLKVAAPWIARAVSPDVASEMLDTEIKATYESLREQVAELDAEP